MTAHTENKPHEEVYVVGDNMVSKPLESSRIRIKNDVVYYLPEYFPENANGLRYLRTGLLLGEMKKGRFEPGQAFAMKDIRF